MRNFVIFGASGDLAKKKLYPALWINYQQGCKCRYFGFGRTEFSDESFRKIVEASVPEADRDFISQFKYFSGTYDERGLTSLAQSLGEKDTIFYFALPTRLEIIKDLIPGLVENDLVGKESIVVLEKPFGDDYSSAKELIDFVDDNLGAGRTYLIDHYLAKDLVRNLITLRFANPIFENLWSNKFIEKIEIEASESLGIENRADYYEKSGAIKDMVQNHALQVLSLVTMDQPKTLVSKAFHQEKEKILKKIRMFNNKFDKNIEIGQYKGYLEEPGVKKDSLTETYVAMTLEIDTPRWRGVKVKVKTGKKLKNKQTEVIIYFKSYRSCLWAGQCVQLAQNKLVINFYPHGDIRLSVNTEFNPVENLPKAKDLTFDFSNDVEIAMPYANALKDIYGNDRLYSPSFEEVLLSWKFIDVVENWLDGRRKNLLKKY